jgi:hypothetical protein
MRKIMKVNEWSMTEEEKFAAEERKLLEQVLKDSKNEEVRDFVREDSPDIMEQD